MGRYTVITSTLSLRISTHCKYTKNPLLPKK
nr:MAG TPA: hypothetical protein [Caudoviricetes sp.]